MKLKLFLILFLLLSCNLLYASEKIDVNSASIEDLLRIKHVGEARAQDIIALRPFYSLDDLIKIKGIGEKTLQEIKEQGLAWVNDSDKAYLVKNNSSLNRIDINSASLQDLILINHIGESRAQDIISSRPFYCLDDLMNIKGIGEKTLENIKKQGLAWVDPALEQKKPTTKKENLLEKRLASLNNKQTASQNKEFVSIFSIGLITALFSGLIIVIIIRTIKQNKF